MPDGCYMQLLWTKDNDREWYRKRRMCQPGDSFWISEKDGEIHCFDLCEFCYDRMIADFQIPVEIQEATELI